MGSIAVGPVTVDLLPGCRVTNRTEPFEPESLQAWAKAVVPGKGALDVGAYSGLYAIAAVKLGAVAVTAVEPFPRMLARAKENAQANQAQIHFIEGAASDWTGDATLWLNSRVSMTSGGSLNAPGTPNGALRPGAPIGIVVKTFRIDDIAWVPFKAIKIDVEGHELNVIRGAMGTIRAYRPTILIEWLTRYGPPSELNRLLQATHQFPVSLDGRNLLYVPLG